jgi:hypothetical protein
MTQLLGRFAAFFQREFPSPEVQYPDRPIGYYAATGDWPVTSGEIALSSDDVIETLDEVFLSPSALEAWHQQTTRS